MIPLYETKRLFFISSSNFSLKEKSFMIFFNQSKFEKICDSTLESFNHTLFDRLNKSSFYYKFFILGWRVRKLSKLNVKF